MERNSISRRKARMRRKRNRAILIGAAAVTAAILCVSVLLWQKKGDALEVDRIEGLESSVSGESITIPVNETQSAEVSVGGIDITGLTLEEAESKLREAFSGTLEVKVGEETVTVENPVDAEIGRLLQQVYTQPGVDQTLALDEQRIRQGIEDQVSALAATWDKSPVNSKLVSFDKKTGAYEYSEEQNGQTMAQQQLAEDLWQRIQTRDYSTPAVAVFSESRPERTKAETKEMYQVIGTFTTKLTNNANRNQNVKLAADAINGMILQAGEEFSFNTATGNRTSEKGYQPAGAYRNGVLIEEPGGGVCQVSTTLYHSIIQSGFKTTERNAHSFAPSYVEKGQDAMVSFDGYAGPDLKFKNTTADPIVLRASVQGLELKISVVGIPALEEGMKVSIRSEKIRDVEPPEPVYEEDPTLPYGTEKIVEQAQKGSVWKSYRVYTKNGTVVKEEPLHNSTYKAKPAQIKRNTTVMTEETTGAGETGGAGMDAGTDTSGGTGMTAGTDASGGTGMTAGAGASGGSGTGAGAGTSSGSGADAGAGVSGGSGADAEAGASGGSGTGAGAGTSGGSGTPAGAGTSGGSGTDAGAGASGGSGETAGAGVSGVAGSGQAAPQPSQPEPDSGNPIVPQNPEN